MEGSIGPQNRAFFECPTHFSLSISLLDTLLN